MSLTEEQYRLAVRARRALEVSDCPAAVEMKTLKEAGWDGDYVVPNQLSSRSLTGPLILLNNWYGWDELEQLDRDRRATVRALGYLPGIPTNRWLDRALSIVGLRRSDVYITQACVYLPKATLGTKVADDVYSISVNRVLRLELGGRTPVALGGPAQRACRNAGIEFVRATHPAYQGGERRSQEIAAAIQKCL